MTTFDVDGTPTAAYLALPPGGGPAPGVLVLHAWWGLTATVIDACDRLAAAGFVALAPDLFAGQTADTAAGAEALAGRFGGDAAYPAVDAAAAALAGHSAVRGPRVGVVGFSFGAAYAIDAMVRQPEAVSAVVAYYGTSGTGDFAAARAAFLGHFATDDPFEPAAAVDVLERAVAGLDATVYRYAAKHWFAEPDRPEYQPAAAELAWARTVAFLRRHG